jgi:hypothetical protein
MCHTPALVPTERRLYQALPPSSSLASSRLPSPILTSIARRMFQGTFSFHLIHPEDGDWNVCWNIWTASTNNIAKLQKPKLPIWKFKNDNFIIIIFLLLYICYLFVYFFIYYNIVLFSCVVRDMRVIFKACYLASGSCWVSVGMSVFPCIFHYSIFSKRCTREYLLQINLYFIYSFPHKHLALINILPTYASALQSKELVYWCMKAWDLLGYLTAAVPLDD